MRRIEANIAKQIKLFRSKGYSVTEISNQVKVSKTSVFRYIEGVEILPEYLSQWASKRGGSTKIKSLKLEKALEQAGELVGSLTDKEKLLILSALYWAEGNKKDFILTNTDPSLIKVFVECLRKVLKIENNRFRVSIRIYEDIDRERSLKFWSSVVGIPKESFVSVNVLSGKKKGKLEFGMCRVRVSKGGDLLKQIMGINQIIAIRLNDK